MIVLTNNEYIKTTMGLFYLISDLLSEYKYYTACISLIFH